MWSVNQTLKGSFSAVSKPIFATKCSLELDVLQFSGRFVLELFVGISKVVQEILPNDENREKLRNNLTRMRFELNKSRHLDKNQS